MVFKIKISNYPGWVKFLPLMLTIDPHMAIAWLNFHLIHTPLNKIKPLMVNTLSLVS